MGVIAEAAGGQQEGSQCVRVGVVCIRKEYFLGQNKTLQDNQTIQKYLRTQA
jgi:hypothetical protein